MKCSCGVKLRFNREKILSIILKCSDPTEYSYDDMADAICAAEKEVIEVCND